VNDHPRLVLAVGLINAPDIDSALDAIGLPSGLLDGLSGGPGGPRGIGEGPGGNVGNGPGGVYSLAVSKAKLTRTPELIFKTEPEYSQEARRAHLQGSVKLRIDVGLDGRPVNIRVVQPMGLGLDEAAIEAVKRWRFRPALVGDKPVVAPALVEVGFHLL
jgi:TonB family protein